jgi:sialate O-acetylesterase
MNKNLIVIILCLVLPNSIIAQIQVPNIFSDHLVLQRHLAIPIWGQAKALETLEIQLASYTIETQATAKGHWKVYFPEMEAGGPYQLKIKSTTDSLIINDVLIGEVWLCSGQSNMEWPLKRSNNAQTVIPKANYNQIRFFHLKKKHNGYKRPYTPAEITEFEKGNYFHPAQWEISSPESAAAFSGVGFFFGKNLYDSLQIPIGLIQNAVGGSPIQSWISKEALANHPQLKEMLGDVNGKTWLDSKQIHPWLAERAMQNWANIDLKNASTLPPHPFAPAYLFEAAIKTIAPYAIRGTIWYQGESNATHPENYFLLKEALLKDWRDLWQQGDFPFYYVQLPRIGNRSRWADFRAIQEACLKINNTAMVVSIDQGDFKDVHPSEKSVIGQRLANLALAKTYHKALHANAYSPSLAYYHWQAKAKQIKLYFKNIGTALFSRDKENIKGFRLQGFIKNGSEEVIIAPTNIELHQSHITLSMPQDFLPSTIKYAWAPFPENSIINSAGLPLAPFKIVLNGNN